MVTRMIADHDLTSLALRRPLNFRDACNLHQAAGCFIHFLSILEKMMPAQLFPESKQALESQFMQAFMDGDLLHVISDQVPPGDVESVQAFRFLR